MVVVPALLLWTLVGLVGFGLYGLVALFEDETVCTVARIPLHGELTATTGGVGGMEGYLVASEDIVADIQEADADDSIQAILVDVDSPGGTPVAGDEVARALQNVSKPTVAVIHDMGTSAAYWASAGTDYIIASPVSDVGSIGVTMSYTELAGSNKEDGSRWIGISSGTFKDAGNPDRPLSEEEEIYFQGQVDAVHEYMVHRIAELRPALTKERYGELADGKAYIGSEALSIGLIDAVGGVDEALAHVEAALGLGAHEAILCPASERGWDTFL